MNGEAKVELEFNQFSELVPNAGVKYKVETLCMDGHYIDRFAPLMPCEEDPTVYRIELNIGLYTPMGEFPPVSIFYGATNDSEAFVKGTILNEEKSEEVLKYIQSKIAKAPIIQMPGMGDGGIIT